MRRHDERPDVAALHQRLVHDQLGPYELIPMVQSRGLLAQELAYEVLVYAVVVRGRLEPRPSVFVGHTTPVLVANGRPWYHYQALGGADNRFVVYAASVSGDRLHVVPYHLERLAPVEPALVPPLAVRTAVIDSAPAPLYGARMKTAIAIFVLGVVVGGLAFGAGRCAVDERQARHEVEAPRESPRDPFYLPGPSEFRPGPDDLAELQAILNTPVGDR